VVKKQCEDNPNDQPLTSSARSFTLYLPEYSAKDVLKDRLMAAILHGQPSDMEAIPESEDLFSV
jgi:hypothetical protein